ncbi:hypothetical protein MD484_g4892, partial [Candolleomyces efflorescens]
MFTPPSSPQPKPGASFAEEKPPQPSQSPRYLSPPPTTPTPSPKPSPKSSQSPQEDAKRRTGRRFRNAVILVPIVLITITLTARFLSQGPPPVLASLSNSWSWPRLFPNTPCAKQPERVVLDKREPSPQTQPTSTTSSPAPTSSSLPTSTTVPTVPSAAPALPTPFPQSFDGVIAKNFSTVSCLNFFTSMINAQPFRSCRPFSLLLETSNDFVQAQTNLTLLNNLIWGTCNTVTTEDQCLTNMSGFATSLRTECATELRENNAMAVGTLRAIEAYGLMRDAACLSDPTTNTYCFLNAARDTNPTNLYYYSLPLGSKLPARSTDPQCTACLKSLMGLYGAALKDASQARLLSGLVATYEDAAETTLGKCGAGFAQTGIVSGVVEARVPALLVLGSSVVLASLLGGWTL